MQVTQVLLEAGAEVSKPNAHKHTPLHLAAQNGHLALSKLLVENGANLDYADVIGKFTLRDCFFLRHGSVDFLDIVTVVNTVNIFDLILLLLYLLIIGKINHFSYYKI